MEIFYSWKRERTLTIKSYTAVGEPVYHSTYGLIGCGYAHHCKTKSSSGKSNGKGQTAN